MVYIQTQTPNLDKFLRALDWKILIKFMAIWNIWLTFGIFYDHLVHLLLIWYIFAGFCIIDQNKSGNPGPFDQCTFNSTHFLFCRLCSSCPQNRSNYDNWHFHCGLTQLETTILFSLASFKSFSPVRTRLQDAVIRSTVYPPPISENRELVSYIKQYLCIIMWLGHFRP
jgi:hypothetical protein